ncbi:MAG: protein translocase subunit SecF [Nocardioidaceae bacterium]|nr:protein translocase subunit SecF [Nocardioidaceae bacterium]MDQ3325372.1 protein translocase subunit SecF [Actinomycetota bacterium]
MSRMATFGQQLYTGKVSFDFVGRRNLWYLVSALIVVAAAVGLIFRGLDPGIEFKGGVEFNASITANDASVESLRDAAINSGANVGSPLVTTSGPDAVLVQTQPLDQAAADEVAAALQSAGAQDVSQERVGPTFGGQILNRALLALGVFLVLVVLFIAGYFREWKMSVAAIVALLHDVLITVGVYAWSGFEVTPATVTGLLTILGYSLYDTVVVFDKVRENTRNYQTNLSRTYAEHANLAVNQTLVRSINTTITALLPVLALLIVGTVVLGTGPLKDLALALFVGMTAGAYSSIFIATPLAVHLKENEAVVSGQAERVAARRAHAVAATGGEPSGGATRVTSGGAPARVARPSRAVSEGRRQPQRKPRSQRGQNNGRSS